MSSQEVKPVGRKIWPGWKFFLCRLASVSTSTASATPLTNALHVCRIFTVIIIISVMSICKWLLHLEVGRVAQLV